MSRRRSDHKGRGSRGWMSGRVASDRMAGGSSGVGGENCGVLRGKGSDRFRVLKQFWPIAALQMLLFMASSPASTVYTALMTLTTTPWKYVDAVWNSILAVDSDGCERSVDGSQAMSIRQ